MQQHVRTGELFTLSIFFVLRYNSTKVSNRRGVLLVGTDHRGAGSCNAFLISSKLSPMSPRVVSILESLCSTRVMRLSTLSW